MSHYTVEVRGLELYAYIGVSECERTIGHRLVMDISVEAEGNGLDSDDVNDTVDYATLCEIASQYASGSNFFLLEKLGNTLIDCIFSQLETVNYCEVTIHKLAPPIPQIVQSVGITIARHRSK